MATALSKSSSPLGQLYLAFTRHSQLTWELTKREITDRYSGQVAGALWAIGHPLFLMAIYVFLFTYVFSQRIPVSAEMPRSFPTYILAGLVPWMGFSELMAKSSTLIIGNAGIVKQVVFPIEVLPVKAVLASLVTQTIATLILLLVMLASGDNFSTTLLLVPLLFAFQLLGMLGVCCALAAIGPFFRDIKDIVQVFVTAGLFLAPILYLPAWLESAWRPLSYVLSINPFSHMVWCYQDAIYFGRIEHPWSWLVFPVLSLYVWYVGSKLFAKLRHTFGDAL